MNIFIRITFVLIALLWLAGSILPLLHFAEAAVVFPFLQIFYSPVCHQSASKLICGDLGCSFLCARCTGIYSGVFLIAFFSMFKKKLKAVYIKYLFILSVPLLIDVLLVSSGVYEYSKITAYFTGLIFGSTAFYYFYTGVLFGLINEKEK